MIKFGLFLVNALVLTQAEEMKFFYTVPQQSNQCFMQNIQEDHQGKQTNSIVPKQIFLFHVGFVSMKSDSSRMIMNINDPKGREIDRQMGEAKMEKKFDVSSGGQHQICVQNQETREIKVEIFLQTGEWTDDFNKVITKKHL